MNRIGRQGFDGWIRLTQKRKSEVNYIYNFIFIFVLLLYFNTEFILKFLY